MMMIMNVFVWNADLCNCIQAIAMEATSRWSSRSSAPTDFSHKLRAIPSLILYRLLLLLLI